MVNTYIDYPNIAPNDVRLNGWFGQTQTIEQVHGVQGGVTYLVIQAIEQFFTNQFVTHVLSQLVKNVFTNPQTMDLESDNVKAMTRT